MLRSWKLWLGVLLLVLLGVSAGIGPLLIDEAATQPLYAAFNKPPSTEFPLGTDDVGRDLLALLVYGLWPTLSIGIIAGTLGTGIGTVLGLISGYFRGPVDVVIRTLSDIVLTIPLLVVLILIASFTRTTTIEGTALIVGLLAWAGPTRAIRAQTLSLRERAFVRVAKLTGFSHFEIVFLDLLPNLLPYILAGFIDAIAGGILASVGLQLLGIGPLLIPNMGMTLNSAFAGGAMIRGFWWWWGPPVLILAVLFFATFLITLALDEIVNPRLRGTTQ
jgi:peptide/nickel transport system permease protein